MNDQPTHQPWYRRIGPGLITACVVIGPGSLVTSSKVGASEQYSMLWVVVVSVAFMMLYMTLGAKLGAVGSAAPCDLIAAKAGRWLSVLVGLSVFFIATAFQSGNNIGVAATFEAFIDSKTVVAGMVILFNLLAIVFLFAFKDMYKMLERVMMALVGLMLISFAINLISLRPDLAAMGKGLVTPTLGKSGELLPILGLIGTTFISAAAFYQAYLVRQKGWGIDEVKSGMVDARIGSIIMFLITVMLMSTAAAGLSGRADITLNSPVDVAIALESTFGPAAKIIFCFGLFSAAYSSFLVNAMIGGFMAADGLNMGSRPTDLVPRLLTAASLLLGMAVGVAVLIFDFDRTPTIIAAQAVTVVAAPLIAGVLLWLTSSRDVMGEHVNRPATIVFGLIGLGLLLAMAGKTAFSDLPKKLESYLPAAASASADPQ
ncbi:Nramp family divalent metal transporter [Rosistilla oblonga]|uniref:Nramp family divalent metal transporter n=1 Tax=Rosistilla oblonga TaxID=2527990 RepID=UPI003A96E38A